MRDLNDKITGGELSADEWNDLPSELQNIIEYSGQTLTSVDLSQLQKGVTVILSNIAALRSVTEGKGIVFIKGYLNDGDQGGGLFYWDPVSTETDNGGTIIKATSIAIGRWKRFYSGGINIKWFGGKVDGVTDDSAAATDAGLVGVVYIPSGTCLIDNQIIFPNGLYGDGIDQTIIKHGPNVTAGAPLLVLGGYSTNIEGANCRDLTIDGNSSIVSSFLGAELGTNKNSIIENVEIINFNGQGIDAGSYGSGCTINKCIITGTNSATLGSEFGVWFLVDATTGVKITNSVFTDIKTAAILGGGSGAIISGNYFYNNHIQTSPTGGGQIALASVSGTDPTMNIISNNYIGTGGGALTSGIEANGYTNIIGNTIEEQPNFGIVLQQGSEYNITGNTVKNGNTSAIFVQAGVSDFIINSNNCYDDQGIKTQTYGIEVQAGASNNYIITDNKLDGNLTAALLDAGTGTNKIISDNTPTSTNAWISFTPIITQGATPTFATTYANYRITGKTVHLRLRVVFDGVTPGTAANAIQISGWPSEINPNNSSAFGVVGNFLILDTTATLFYAGSVSTQSATVMVMISHGLANSVGITPNFGVVNGDVLSINCTYEAV